MATRTIVKSKAADFKAGMSLDEVQNFIYAALDVPSVGEFKRGPVRCTVNMRGGIKELSVEVLTDGGT